MITLPVFRIKLKTQIRASVIIHSPLWKEKKTVEFYPYASSDGWICRHPMNEYGFTIQLVYASSFIRLQTQNVDEDTKMAI